MNNKGYGLFTTIAMIVGVVIGSGIFFKSDNILVATGGNIALGVLVFTIAAIAIIFGSLTISELASRSSNSGGMIQYMEFALNKSAACAFGWFQTLLYFPTLIAVVAYVAGIYICLLFGINGSFDLQVLIGLGVILILFAVNTISAKVGGVLQSSSTIIKLIPLILIAIVGIIYGNPSMEALTTNSAGLSSAGWLAAIAPIAFSFDGWIVATTIGDEVKDSKRNLPRALVVAPIFILLMYIVYFVGISVLVGPEKIMALGDAHVDLAAKMIFGHLGAKIILVFVIISVLGTVNGLIMGMMRQPYLLAKKGMLPQGEIFAKVNAKNEMPINSSIIAGVITLLWMAVHYFVTKSGMLTNSDISEISVTMSYGLYIILYIKVFRMALNGEVKSRFKGFICPVLAVIGSIIIIVGGMSNAMFWTYASICLAIIISGALYWRNKERTLATQGQAVCE